VASPVDLVLEGLAEATGQAPRRSGQGWMSRCPAHEDRRPSLSVGVGGDGRVLLTCHAGCPTETVVAALGLKMSDLFPERGSDASGRDPLTTVHPFGEFARRRGWCPGALLLLDARANGQVVRLPMRDHLGNVVGFKQRRKDCKPIQTEGGETKSKTEAGGRHALFFPHPLPAEEPMAVLEGEADTLAALSAGHPSAVGTAGVNPGPLGRVALQYLLAGRPCVLFPHSGEGGQAWLEEVGSLLSNAKCDVRFVPADSKWDDLDERLRSVGRGERMEALRRMMEAAVPWQAAGEPATSSWRILTLADAYAPRPPLVYLVEGIVPRPSLIVVYGAPGVLKSFLVADMAMCVAGGLPWLPSLPSGDANPKAVVQAPVLWCDFDNGRRRTDERVEALGKAYELPASTPFYYVSMPSPWLDVTDAASLGLLGSLVRAKQIGLCVIDNLGTVSAGADENSSEMIGVMSHLRQLAEANGLAVTLIHHQRKSTQFHARTGESLRGHSSIEAALDLALLCEREEGAPQVVLRSTKTRDVDVLPFGAVFTYEHKEGTQELASARFYGMEVEDTESDRAARKAILDTVGSQRRLNQQQLVGIVKKTLPNVGQNRIRSIADQLVAEGELKEGRGKHNAKLYEIP